jgi:hypothetical protein
LLFVGGGGAPPPPPPNPHIYPFVTLIPKDPKKHSQSRWTRTSANYADHFRIELYLRAAPDDQG